MRKATGISRNVDDLGRIVIPIELRRTLCINIGDPLQVKCDEKDRTIVLTPHQPGCVFCGESDAGQLVEIRGRKVCRACCGEAKWNDGN